MNFFARISIVLFVIWLHIATLYADSGFVGVIVDGFTGSCTVTHNNKVYNCIAHKDLHVGDIISKTPSLKELEIRLDPYVELKKLSADKSEIVYRDVPNNLNILEWAKGFIDGFLKPIKCGYFTAATRGPDDIGANEESMCELILEDELNKPVDPDESGQFFTAIYGYKEPVEFTWRYDLSAIVFKLDEKEIFKKDIKGLNSIKLSPEKMGLKRGETYTWYYEYDGSPLVEKYIINLLDEQTEKDILNNLKLIDNQKIDSTEKIIQKSTYLQLVSDKDRNTDLYWLSYQILPKDVSGLNKDYVNLLCKLKYRYIKYLDNLGSEKK